MVIAGADTSTAVITAVAATVFVATDVDVFEEGIVKRFGKIKGWRVDGLERKGQRLMLALRMRMKKPVREEAR